MVEISCGRTTGATVPGAQLQTLATSRHRVTPPEHVQTQHTFMQLFTAANHSILQGFKNVVALYPATNSEQHGNTYPADQSVPGGYSGIWILLRCTKNCFLSACLCLGRVSALPALVGAMHRVRRSETEMSRRTGRGALVLNIYRKCLQVSTY